MICLPCQRAEHTGCIDRDHPHQLYRACYCQHRPAQHDTPTDTAAQTPPGKECETE